MINFSKTPLLNRNIYQEVRQILVPETRIDLGGVANLIITQRFHNPNLKSDFLKS